MALYDLYLACIKDVAEWVLNDCEIKDSPTQGEYTNHKM